MARTDTILSALWEASQGGQYSVRKYRVVDLTGSALTVNEDRAILDTGLVVEVPGMGGPSSYRFTIAPDDMRASA